MYAWAVLIGGVYIVHTSWNREVSHHPSLERAIAYIESVYA